MHLLNFLKIGLSLLRFYLARLETHTFHRFAINRMLYRWKCLRFEYLWSCHEVVVDTRTSNIIEDLQGEEPFEADTILELMPKTTVDKFKEVRSTSFFDGTPRNFGLLRCLFLHEQVTHKHLQGQIPEIPNNLSIRLLFLELITLPDVLRRRCFSIPSEWCVDWKFFIVKD